MRARNKSRKQDAAEVAEIMGGGRFSTFALSMARVRATTTKGQIVKKAGIILGLILGFSPLQTWAQPGPGGDFDPAEMRQRMMSRYREMMEVTNDDEWKAVQTRIEKVMEARREASFGGMRMMGGPGGGLGGGRGGDGPSDGPGGPPPGGGFGGPGFGGTSNPELEALQKAIENKASGEELKAKLTALRTARKAKQAKLEAAQEDLKKILSTRQEAAAVVAGLLP